MHQSEWKARTNRYVNISCLRVKHWTAVYMCDVGQRRPDYNNNNNNPVSQSPVFIPVQSIASNSAAIQITIKCISVTMIRSDNLTINHTAAEIHVEKAVSA